MHPFKMTFLWALALVNTDLLVI